MRDGRLLKTNVRCTNKLLSTSLLLLLLFCMCVFQTSLEDSGISPKVSCVKIASQVSVVAEAGSHMESRAANASNKEISIQWYIPSLAKPANDADTKV